jgi:predicted transcriptional regulator
MATKRIRHLFVCDAENRPIKTITSLDLLRQALHTPIEA